MGRAEFSSSLSERTRPFTGDQTDVVRYVNLTQTRQESTGGPVPTDLVETLLRGNVEDNVHEDTHQSCLMVALVPRHPTHGRIGAQFLAGSGDGGVTRPTRVSGVKQSPTYASCAMECTGVAPSVYRFKSGCVQPYQALDKCWLRYGRTIGP